MPTGITVTEIDTGYTIEKMGVKYDDSSDKKIKIFSDGDSNSEIVMQRGGFVINRGTFTIQAGATMPTEMIRIPYGKIGARGFLGIVVYADNADLANALRESSPPSFNVVTTIALLSIPKNGKQYMIPQEPDKALVRAQPLNRVVGIDADSSGYPSDIVPISDTVAFYGTAFNGNTPAVPYEILIGFLVMSGYSAPVDFYYEMHLVADDISAYAWSEKYSK